MAELTIALEWSENADFSGGLTGIWRVLGAAPYRQPVEGPRVVWGRRRVNTTARDRMITVVFDHFSVDGTKYDQDFGDMLLLEEAIFAPYLRIIATGTSLPRVGSSGLFWPTYIGSGLEVVRESYSPATAADAGADTATVTFAVVEPNT